MPHASSFALIVVLAVVLAFPGARVVQHALPSAGTPTSLPAVDVAAAAPSQPETPDIAEAAPQQAPASDQAQRGIAPPEVSAEAVYAMDLQSGTVLYNKNADERRPIASITKVITALVTVKHVSLDEQVTIIESDLLDPNSPFTKMGLRSGDTLRVVDLLQGLLIPSGGDAAKALARYVGSKLSGSDDPATATTAFIDEMNAYAQSLGLKDSYFTDPDGEDDSSAFSSAHDVTILGGELMKNADLAWIVNQPNYTIPSQLGEPYQQNNTNSMLGQDGVIGIKTGSTEGAGASLLLARSVNGGENTVVMAVLGSTLTYDDQSNIVEDDRYTDSQTIFADMDARFTWTSLDAVGDTFPGLAEEMAVWDVELKDPPVMPIDLRKQDKPSYQLVLGPPTDGGKQAGSVLLYSGDTAFASVPVFQIGGDSGILEPRSNAQVA